MSAIEPYRIMSYLKWNPAIGSVAGSQSFHWSTEDSSVYDTAQLRTKFHPTEQSAHCAVRQTCNQSNFIGHISYDETSALIEGFRTLILRISRSRRLYKKCKPNEKLCNLEVLKQGDSLQLEV